MKRKSIIIPNLLVLSCTLAQYHKSFLAGHFTRIGLLLIAASLLSLLYAVCQGIQSRIYTVIAVLVNAVLFCLYGYIFAGTSYMLVKNEMADMSVYTLILSVWVLAVLTAVKGKSASVIFSIILILCGATWLYFRTSMQWAANLNAAMYGIITAISAVNIYCIVSTSTRE